MGLLGVAGEAGAGGEVRTAVSGVGSRPRSQHTLAQAPPGPLHAPCFLDLRETHPPNFCLQFRVEVLLSGLCSGPGLSEGRGFLFLSPSTQSSSISGPIPLTTSPTQAKLASFDPLSMPTCRDLGCGLLLLGLGWGG